MTASSALAASTVPAAPTLTRRRAVVYQIYPWQRCAMATAWATSTASVRGSSTWRIPRGRRDLDQPVVPTSSMKDAGYDVLDYRAIEPVLGTMADAEALIAARTPRASG